jgi:hypothetical protein
MVRGQLLLVVMMGKELVVLLPGTHLHLLVVAGAWPLLPTFMSKGLRRVVLFLMLLLLQLLLLLWDLQLPGLARSELLVLVLVLLGTNMCLMMALLVVLLQVLVGDSPLLPRPVGKGLTAVPVMQLLVLLRRVFMLPGGGMQLVGGKMVPLVGGELRQLLLVL